MNVHYHKKHNVVLDEVKVKLTASYLVNKLYFVSGNPFFRQVIQMKRDMAQSCQIKTFFVTFEFSAKFDELSTLSLNFSNYNETLLELFL